MFEFLKRKKTDNELVVELREVQECIANTIGASNTTTEKIQKLRDRYFIKQSDYYDFFEKFIKLIDGTITREELVNGAKVNCYDFENPFIKKLVALKQISIIINSITDELEAEQKNRELINKLKQRESEIKKELNIK
ncbi:MAG: hypothetical protein NC548_15845 [Lachnospiraceae bacterium]|nr:hypothetical protein [Lachnospiraceae bacterium]